MVWDAEDITALMLILVWTCYTSTPATLCNFLFTRVLLDQDVLLELLKYADLSYAPGLFEVLTAATPPTIDFFKSLPDIYFGHWTVYAIILEKDGCRPRVYIGSGTSAENGVKVRFNQYDNKIWLPVYVEQSINEGYVITHKKPLVWMSRPRKVDVPHLRVLFVAIEGALTFALWVYRLHEDYHGMKIMCAWDFKDFEYDGAASHTPFSDTIICDFDLTPEDLAAKAAHWAMKTREAVVRYRKWRHNNPEKAAEFNKRREQKAYAEHKFLCKTCEHVFPDGSKLKDHEESRMHLRAVEHQNGTAWYFACLICHQYFDEEKKLETHKQSSSHLMQSEALKDTSDNSQRVMKTRPRAPKGTQYPCEPCGFVGKQKCHFTAHVKTKGHLDKIASLKNVKKITTFFTSKTGAAKAAASSSFKLE